MPIGFKDAPSLELLKASFEYDPETGLFRSRKKSRRLIGGKSTEGYIALRLDGVRYVAHRLAWFYVTSEWPLVSIDHINGKKWDNRFCNLRKATFFQQCGNRIGKSNQSGIRGVKKCKNRWKAEFRKVYLGSFKTPEEAKTAYEVAANLHYGEFYNRREPSPLPEVLITPSRLNAPYQYKGKIRNRVKVLSHPIDAETLRRVLHYDPKNGVFVWISGIREGKTVGNAGSRGYRQMSIADKTYRLHRLAWLYMTGKWPEETVDHINRIRSDNRWCNLRAANYKENGWNARRKSKSGTAGVRQRDGGRWEAKIYLGEDGGLVYLGTHDTAAEAKEVRDKVAKGQRGDFCDH